MNKLLANEQMFAAMNEHVARATSRLAPADFPADFTLELYCECANKACYERVSITHDDYLKIKEPNTFVVRPEHYLPEFERLMSQSGTYWVIAKRPEKLDKDFEI